MVCVVQRVAAASVSVDGQTEGSVGNGLLAFLGVEAADTGVQLAWMADKVAGLRIFRDPETEKMNLSVKDIGGGVLVIPNFTLCGDTSHGKRPDFTAAARPEQAMPMFEAFAEALRARGIAGVETGVFGARMRVEADNDGPVTLIIRTP